MVATKKTQQRNLRFFKSFLICIMGIVLKFKNKIVFLHNGEMKLYPLFSEVCTKKVGDQEIREGFSGETDQKYRKGIWKPPSWGILEK